MKLNSLGYLVKTNSIIYAKFQFNVSQDCHRKDRKTEMLSDRLVASKVRFPRQAGRGLKIIFDFPNAYL